jgi:hypothetical protein
VVPSHPPAETLLWYCGMELKKRRDKITTSLAPHVTARISALIGYVSRQQQKED